MTDEQKICRSVLKLFHDQEIIMIGIDGLGGSGKSTISEKICAELEKHHLQPVLLHIDDFIHVRNIRYHSAYPDWQCYYYLQWRYDYFIDVISRLKQKTGSSIEIELYDKENDRYITQKFSIQPGTAVITEGVFLQRKELQGMFDYMIYLDIPEKIRMKRVLKRDTYIGSAKEITAKYENRYFPAEHYYVETYHPEKTADLIIGQ